jgi:hypothetical protein
MNGLPCHPEEDFGHTGASASCGSGNGFVFSPAEINRAIDRDNRLKAAKLAAIAPPKPFATHQSPVARAA